MLSDKAIQALRPDPDRPGTKHHDRDGLYLWVARSGSKTWRKDYRWQGARRTFTIGAYPAMRLADARKQALELNTWIKTGIDPRTQAPSQQPAPPSSFGDRRTTKAAAVRWTQRLGQKRSEIGAAGVTSGGVPQPR
jgi:hypothetical protein